MKQDPTEIVIAADLLLPIPLSMATRSVFTVIYVVIIILALLGNVTVIIVIIANKSMRSVTNICFVSIAVSDVIIATCPMPLNLAYLLSVEWFLGEFMCRFTSYVQGVSVASGILTLVVVSIDRYHAICHPVGARRIHTPRRAIIILVITWTISLVVLIPQFFLKHLKEKFFIEPLKSPPVRLAYSCEEVTRDQKLMCAYKYFTFSALYILPIFLMFAAYAKVAHRLWIRTPVGDILTNPQLHYRHIYQKKRAVRLLIMIAVVFTVCWIPFFSLRVYLLNNAGHPVNRVLAASVQLWGYLNCAMNPIIYAAMSENFYTSLYNVNFWYLCDRKSHRKTPISITHETYM